MRYFSITAFMMVPLLTLASSRLLLRMKTAQNRYAVYPSRIPSVASPVTERGGNNNSKNTLGPNSGVQQESRTPFDDLSNYIAQSSKMMAAERVASPTAFILKPMGASSYAHNALVHARSHSHSREGEEVQSRSTDERSRGEHGQHHHNLHPPLEEEEEREREGRDVPSPMQQHPSIRLHHQYMQRKRWWWVLGAHDDRPVETRVSIDISPEEQMIEMNGQGGTEGYQPRFQVSRLGRYDHWV
jgi:hypothetical protein